MVFGWVGLEGTLSDWVFSNREHSLSKLPAKIPFDREYMTFRFKLKNADTNILWIVVTVFSIILSRNKLHLSHAAVVCSCHATSSLPHSRGVTRPNYWRFGTNVFNFTVESKPKLHFIFMIRRPTPAISVSRINKNALSEEKRVIFQRLSLRHYDGRACCLLSLFRRKWQVMELRSR